MKSLRSTPVLAAAGLLAFGATARANIYVTEVAPWSSGYSALEADWFEIYNGGSSAVNITGWRMDDSSARFDLSVALSGITIIGAGESVIFIETSSLATAAAAFNTLWFGANPPAGLQIGAYDGAVGLSVDGDAVNIYDGSGVLQGGVSFGASLLGPYPTFDNAALLNGAISQFSVAGVNGAFAAANSAAEIGSPGLVPEPGTSALVLLGAGMLAAACCVGPSLRLVRAWCHRGPRAP